MVVTKFPVLSETFILNQITGLIERGHEVHILSFNKGDTEITHELIDEYNLMDNVYYLCGDIPSNKIKRVINVLPMIMKNSRDIKFKDVIESINFLQYGKNVLSLRCLYALYNIKQRNNYDIIHAQFGPHGVESLLLKKLNLLSGRIVTSFRGYDITCAIKDNIQGYKKLFLEEGLLLPVCDHFKNILLENGCSEEKIRVHYSGVDINKFSPPKNKRSENKSLKIISTARLEEKKGLVYSIKAVTDLVKDGINVKYTIIGEGSIKKELMTLVESNNMHDHIKLVGRKNQDDVLKYLQSSDLLLAPSVEAKDGNQEGIPNAIKEAMLMNVPVISTFHSGIPELITDNQTGFLVPERDFKAIYEKIIYFMNNPKIKENIVLNAAKKVKTRFCIEKLNDNLVDIYDELLLGEPNNSTKKVKGI